MDKTSGAQGTWGEKETPSRNCLEQGTERAVAWSHRVQGGTQRTAVAGVG